jgi:hypothetical protein
MQVTPSASMPNRSLQQLYKPQFIKTCITKKVLYQKGTTPFIFSFLLYQDHFRY